MNREKSIELLNLAVNEELTAVHQYMYFHFHCEDMGYELLSQLFKRISIREMIHVEMLAERILFLKGDVNMIPSAKTEKITDPKGMLEKVYQMETATVNNYNEWARICGEQSDAASKTLFEELIKEEETHQDQFETELDNLNQFGEKYLALQSVEHSKIVAKSSGSSE